MSNISIDLSTIRNAPEGSALAKLRDHLMTRQRYPVEPTVAQTRKVLGADFRNSDSLAVLRELEGLGAGKVILGRKGRETRFVWALHPSELAKALHGDEAILSTTKTVDDDIDDDVDYEEVELVEHRLNLRDGFDVELTLPKDLTVEERKRISTWITVFTVSNKE